MPFSSLFSPLKKTTFRVTEMVIFVLVMVFTILMTIASPLKAVFGWSENFHFHRRSPLGRCTDKLQKAERPSANV